MVPAPSRQRRPLSQGVASRGRWRKMAANPVVQFFTAGAVALVLVVVGSGWLSERAATEEAIRDVRSTTELLARSAIQPTLTRGVVRGKPAAVDKFDRQMLRRVLVGDVLRLKIWDQDGRIVYSDQARLIGERFELGGAEHKILLEGGSDADVSDLTEPENRFERGFGRLLEVYTQVRAPGGRRLLFEVYFSYDDVSRRSGEVLGAFRPITTIGLLVFLALTGPLVWVLARRLDAAAAIRERLLVSAVDASDIERRRIARDLHDGVVQDLAGTSFALSAAAREEREQPLRRRQLETLAAGVRHSLRSLRSLLVEIYPPELSTEGLAAALDDLLAPAAAAGIDVEVHVVDTSDLPDDDVRLSWRVAQEAVRNVQRHAHASHLAVIVTRAPDAVTLEVVDDGTGFDPSLPPEAGHLGLRSLHDLVRDTGGTLAVTSRPGAGTRVKLELPRR